MIQNERKGNHFKLTYRFPSQPHQLPVLLARSTAYRAFRSWKFRAVRSTSSLSYPEFNRHSSQYVEGQPTAYPVVARQACPGHPLFEGLKFCHMARSTVLLHPCARVCHPRNSSVASLATNPAKDPRPRTLSFSYLLPPKLTRSAPRNSPDHQLSPPAIYFYLHADQEVNRSRFHTKNCKFESKKPISRLIKPTYLSRRLFGVHPP